MKIGSALGLSIHRQLYANDIHRSKSLERLSSGLRINRASDDAGGLAVSENMRARVRGLMMAMRNVQDGRGALYTAEGTLQQIQEVLQKMHEVAVRGANGTHSRLDRLALQAELEGLKNSIDGMAYATSFNGIKLLVDQDKVQRTSGLPYSYLGSAVAPDPAPFGFPANPNSASFVTGGGATVSGVTPEEVQAAVDQLPFLLEGALKKAEAMLYNSGLNQSAIVPAPNVYYVIDSTSPTRYSVSDSNNIVINLYPIYGTPPANPDETLQQAMTQAVSDMLSRREDSASAVDGDVTAFLTQGAIGSTAPYENMAFFFSMAGAENYLSFDPPATFSFDTVAADRGRADAAWFARYLMENYGQSAVEEVSRIIIDSDTGNKAAIATALDTYLLGLTGEASRANLATTIDTWIGTQSTTSAGVTNSLSNTADTGGQLLGTLTIQAGPDATDQLDLELYAAAIGNLDYAALAAVTDQDTAQRSVTTLQKAIQVVSSARAAIGAQINELDMAMENLATQAENLMATESRIRDADMAAEVTDQARTTLIQATAQDSLRKLHRLTSEKASLLLASALKPADNV